MAELKQSRWVKIHEPGQANFEERDNIMDIVVGANRCQANVTYTVRTHKKAAFWLERYLDAAGAADILTQIAEQLREAAESKEDIALNAEKWSCEIEKMDQGVFKVQVMWQTDEPVTRKQTAKRSRRRSKKNAPAEAEAGVTEVEASA